jgi:hypothetical protein
MQDTHAAANAAAVGPTARHLYIAGTVLMLAGILAVQGLPRTAVAASPASPASFDAVLALPSATIHEGVDWSRVVAAPVDTGATVGAYDR